MKHDPKALFHWTAPNTLTLVGLICMVVPASIMLYYSGDLMTPVPSWIYIINAIMIFVYQTMDALDGKQANFACECAEREPALTWSVEAGSTDRVKHGVRGSVRPRV